MLGRLLVSMNRTTLYTCSIRRGPPTRPYRVYAVFYYGLDQTFQSGRQALRPLCVQLMALVRAHWNLAFYCIQGWFSFFLRRVRPRGSLLVPVVAHTIGGSMALLALWIRTLKAQGSSTSQSRQTRPGAELSGPFCFPHLVVAFQLFFNGRRPVALR